ncbi:MAG: imidazole glycerol phosphate synthase subunit HisF [Chloroflexota bacterium]
MLSKRIISCLDVRNGQLAKSIKFENTKDIGDPVEQARKYYSDGIDELVFYDITASNENRNIMIDVVSDVAQQVFIPFSVGGGLRTVDDCSRVLLAGAEKININSAAVKNPTLISDASTAFGAQAVVLSMDVLRVQKTDQIPSGYEVIINGGRTPMGLDAVQWARKGEMMGAGEIVVNSIDADGTKQGFELIITRLIAENVNIPVIASGGGGKPQDLYDVLTQGKADAAIIASIIHYGEYSIKDIKKYLHERGLPIRMV